MFTCCDESEGDHWWAYGALWLPKNAHIAKYEADVTALRHEANCWGEFKWSKLSRQHLETYSEFVRITLSLPAIKFTPILIDTDLFGKKEMEKYHGEGGKDLAYLKFMRLLLKNRILRFASSDNPNHVVLYDKLSMDRDLVGNFRRYLKRDMEEISFRKGYEVRFTHLSQADSKILNFMQAADLLTGATCWAWEGSPGSGGKATARGAIRDQVEEWAGGALTDESFPAGRYFSAFRWKPK